MSELSSNVPRARIAIIAESSRAVFRGIHGVVSLALVAVAANGADFGEAQNLYLSGNYTQSVAMATAGVIERPWSEDWQVLLTESLLALGRNAEAQAAVSNALDRYPSPRVRWLARDAFLTNGRLEDAEDMVDRIIQ